MKRLSIRTRNKITSIDYLLHDLIRVFGAPSECAADRMMLINDSWYGIKRICVRTSFLDERKR